MKFFSYRLIASRIAVLAACAVLLLMPGLLTAQSPAWQPIGPFGGMVSSLAIHPKAAGVLYAAGNLGGVQKSTNGGLSWQLLPGSPDAGLVVMDPTRPNTLYAVSRGLSNTVYRSTDAGAHWTAVSRNLPYELRITSLTVDPARPVRLYLAAVGGEVWRSGDSGVTWRSVSHGLPGGGPTGTTALVALPRKPAGTAFTGSFGPGLFRTRNAGLSWERVRGLPDEHVTALAISPLDPRVLYVSFEDDARQSAGIYRSQDGGDSWVPAGDPAAGDSAVRTFAIHPRQPLTVYAGNGGAVFKTTDGGQRWAPATPPSSPVLTLAFGAAPPVLYAGTNPGGVLRSVNGGASWTRVNQGLSGLLATSVAVDPADPDILVAAAPPGLYRSADRGAHWSVRAGVDLPPWILAAGPGTFYVSPFNHFRRPVIKSSDAGVTWMETALSDVQQTSLRADPLDPNTVYAIYNYYPSPFEIRDNPEIYRTQDGGAHWTSVADLPDSCPAFDLAVARTSAAPAVLYLSGARPGGECRTSVWRSPDGGATWTEAVAGLPGPVAELAVDPRDTRVVYARPRSAINVWKTMDSGASWQASGLGQRTVTKLATSPSGVVWAYADGVVYRSSDFGATWQKRGDLTWGVYGFAFDPADPRRVYAATPRGVWVLEDRP